jgi:gluconokinase
VSDPHIVTLDVGTSSVRALLFDKSAHQMEGYGAHLPYRIQTTPDGGAEIAADELAMLAIDCLDELHRQVKEGGLQVVAIGSSAFWHSFCGVDENGTPILPLLHLFDTRSSEEVAHVPRTHGSTGCVPHSSYWPAKLLWLERHRTAEFRATRRWLSFPEYLFEKLFGRARVSTSMASASGLWNQCTSDYDAATLEALPVRRDQLADPHAMDEAECRLLPEYSRMWPAFDGVPWYPALGDGAAAHIGSGCLRPDQFSLTVGTTGALRALIPAEPGSPPFPIPDGLWCYRLDRSRALLGGALSNGGEVFAWLKRTLTFPKDLESRLESVSPGGHGLTVLPFLAGERSPYWRGDLRGAITGLSLSTEPFDIVHAALESVALRFREIYGTLAGALGTPAEVIASGGALLRSPAWTQMMADALGRPVIASTEPEASSRGAALYALERLGPLAGGATPGAAASSSQAVSMDALPASTGALFSPRTQFEATYGRLLEQERALYQRLFGTCS